MSRDPCFLYSHSLIYVAYSSAYHVSLQHCLHCFLQEIVANMPNYTSRDQRGAIRAADPAPRALYGMSPESCIVTVCWLGVVVQYRHEREGSA